MAKTEITGKQVKDETILAADIGAGAVRGSDANQGVQREILQGTVSDVDLRASAVTAAKLDATDDYTMVTLALGTGSLSNPALHFSGDVNSGLISLGADIVGLVTNATEALRIDASQNVGLGGSTVTDAILSLNTTTKAFLLPRLTTTQRDAIGTPTAGMLVYNTSTSVLNFYSSSWGEISVTETDPLSIHLDGSNSPSSAIDWNQQEIQQLVIHKLASDPVSPVEGQQWYNTTDKQMKMYNGTSVVILG